MNSVKVSACVVFFQVMTSATAGYVFAKLNFPGRDNIPWRIDIIAIIYSKDRKTIRDFKWYENITVDD